jgi:hypothetical protein
MYCTIWPGPASSGLSDDASSAYHRFWRRARTLGTISSSFHTLALSMAAAYLAALTRPAPEAWSSLVTRTALLVERAHELDGIVVLDANEEEALDFFEAIVRENADLVFRGSIEAGRSFEPLSYLAV